MILQFYQKELQNSLLNDLFGQNLIFTIEKDSPFCLKSLIIQLPFDGITLNSVGIFN